MPVTLRHEPYNHDDADQCDGVPRPFDAARCVECGERLCWCELAYGHDCEAVDPGSLSDDEWWEAVRITAELRRH